MLELNGLSKHFNGTTCALDEVSLATHPNEFVSIVGPSGCGKTTLLRVVAGLEQPDQGSVQIDGQDVGSLLPRERDVAMVFQGESLYPHMTVRENLSFPLKMRKVTSGEIRSTVQRTAEQMGVDDLLDRMPSTLSGGQRQRVAIGRALVRDPKVFLFDEPFSHLDPHLRRQLRNELLTLRQNWTATTLFVTHDQREAAMLGDRVAVMNEGRLLQFDSATAIRESPADDFVKQFVQDEYGSAEL